MKLIIEPSNKKNLYLDKVDGIILSLQDYSVQSPVYYSLEEIKKIVTSTDKEIFININKNLSNNDITNLTEVLKELDTLNIKGIFFYDLALLQIKKEQNLKTDLIWNQTHMVNNYKTCNYYCSRGVKYALLGKEITLEEILEIIKNTEIIPMVEILSLPSVAFSKRKLLTNYYKDLKKEPKKALAVTEKVTDTIYQVTEDCNGTSFFQKDVMNGTGIIKDLYAAGLKYIIMRGYGLEENVFAEVLADTMTYIANSCNDESYITKYQQLWPNTNFFFKKTIYQVKKNV
ncbi:MAG: U32 family peptidase [Mycoplasmatota bacterium]|nr:U32 family peptidase [Mycoplasmatota bacterium]